MKTAVTKKHANNNNSLAVIRKVSVNQSMNPFKSLTRKPENRLSIQGYELCQWLGQLTSSNGLYFLDMGGADPNNYSMHFKHNTSGKLMKLDCPEELQAVGVSMKEFLEALLFDLSLFPDEPILVFDNDEVEKQLRNLATIYYEHAKEIDCIIGRLVNTDMKKLFESGIYNDTRIKELTIDSVYHAFNPGTSICFKKDQGSYGVYLIFLVVQSVFYQIVGKKTMA